MEAGAEILEDHLSERKVQNLVSAFIHICIYIHIYMCVFFNKITMYISKVSYRYNYVCRPPIPLMKAVIVLFIGFVDFVIYVCFARCVFETSDEHRAGRAFLLWIYLAFVGSHQVPSHHVSGQVDEVKVHIAWSLWSPNRGDR